MNIVEKVLKKYAEENERWVLNSKASEEKKELARLENEYIEATLQELKTIK
jgi:hypothetical protein